MISLTTDEIADAIGYTLDAYFKGRIKGEEQVMIVFAGIIGGMAMEKAESVNRLEAFDVQSFINKCSIET